MSLRYIVPTLGLLACSAPTFAADVGGGLVIDGYVDAILEITAHDEAVRDNPGAIPGGDEPSDTTIDFTSAFQIEPSWQIGDDVVAAAEIAYYDGASGFALEQAYVAWAINEQVTFTMGRFHNLIGWEGLDAPDLYRINNSNMYLSDANNGMWGGDLDGAMVSIAPTDSSFTAHIWIADTIFGSVNGGVKNNDELAFGATATFAIEDQGLVFDLDLAYDMGNTVDDSGDSSSTFQIDLNAEWTGMENLLVAADINYYDYDVDSALGALLAVNYAFPETSIPMSVTGMLNYLDPADDTDDDEELEFALALLTNPTNDANFGLNGELRYIDRGADDSSEFGIFVEALAIIP